MTPSEYKIVKGLWDCIVILTDNHNNFSPTLNEKIVEVGGLLQKESKTLKDDKGKP